MLYDFNYCERFLGSGFVSVVSRTHQTLTIASPTNDSKVVIKLFKKIIFPRFGVPRAIISDGGTHFHEKQLDNLSRSMAYVIE